MPPAEPTQRVTTGPWVGDFLFTLDFRQETDAASASGPGYFTAHTKKEGFPQPFTITTLHG